MTKHNPDDICVHWQPKKELTYGCTRKGPHAFCPTCEEYYPRRLQKLRKRQKGGVNHA